MIRVHFDRRVMANMDVLALRLGCSFCLICAGCHLPFPVERFIFHVLNPLKHRFVVHPVVEPFHP